MHPAFALIRFGMGRRGDQALPSDPHAWLLDQLNGPSVPSYPAGLPSSADALDLIRARNQMRKESQVKLDPKDDPVAQSMKLDAAAEYGQWITADDSFRERLVLFWANHFTVSRRNGNCGPLIGAFVREAIRPNVNGDFGTLLLAVMRHPAMLMYLNNEQSIGPHSPAGLRMHKGLNENLGRECMELHTLSPAAGYSQADVTAMATILTGWSVKRQEPGAGFLFRPGAHEPGPKVLMGRTFPGGEQGGIDALAFLASHPATANHIASKLARHFVADNPPPALVAELADRFMATNGNLPEVTRLLIESPAAWQPPSQRLAKLRTPIDFVCATLRAINPRPDKLTMTAPVLARLGQPMWAAPSPKGWSDFAEDWSDPALLLRRVEFGFQAGGLAGNQDVAALTDVALGPYVTKPVRSAIANAGSRREALALLFSSPDFWRR